MAKNRTCITCGERYSYCPSCSKTDALKEPWYATFCCDDCRVIWKTLTSFSMGLLSKTGAKEILSKINLHPVETYADCVQRGLKNVMTEEDVVVSVVEVVEEAQAVEEDAKSVEKEEEPVLEQPVAQPNYSKKNRRKSHVVVQEEV